MKKSTLAALLSAFLLAAQATGQPGEMRLEQITRNGTGAGDASLSSDGKLLLYSTRAKGLLVHVRETATGKEQTFDIGSGHGFKFAPDGKTILFLRETRPGFQVLFECKRDGSEVKSRIEDIDSEIDVSPDGKSIAFLRNVPAERKLHLIVATGAKTRDVANWSKEYNTEATVAWSPDGKQIAIVADLKSKRLILVSVADGVSREVVTPSFVRAVCWPSHSSGPLVLMRGKERPNEYQIWRSALPSGAWTELTNDETGFWATALSSNADATLIATTHRDKIKTGAEDIFSWVGLGDAGPRGNPDVVLIHVGK